MVDFTHVCGIKKQSKGMDEAKPTLVLDNDG